MIGPGGRKVIGACTGNMTRHWMQGCLPGALHGLHNAIPDIYSSLSDTSSVT